MDQQSPDCSGLAVAICTDHHKGGFGEALGLQPGLAAARGIGCQSMFGNDAFKSMLSAGLEKGLTFTIELFAELNAAFLVASQQAPSIARGALRAVVAAGPCR